MIEDERLVTYHTVTLGAMTREGDTLAEIIEEDVEGTPTRQTLHVPAGLPGERVTIAVETPAQPRPGRHRRRWKQRPPRVWITAISEPSPLRVQAPCPVFGVCGGCQLQHMRYEAQLAWKRSVVEQLLRNAGGFATPPLLETVGCANPWHYRNHMRFSVNRSGQPGLTARGTHRVLPLDACPIAHEHINTALSVLSQRSNERPQLLIRCGTATGQVLIQPQPRPEVIEQLAAVLPSSCLGEASHDSDGFLSGEQGQQTDRGRELDIRIETLEEKLAGETFRIRPSSFFQTNTAQAEKMAQMVLDGLLYPRGHGDLSGNPAGVANSNGHSLTVVDAYCGVGTFALLLARHVGKVIAIEEAASAIKDARWNLREAGNVEILKGKVEELLPALAEQVDGLVIDPPRAGCQQVILDALIQHPVSTVVYVSCDPSTLARDLNILCHLHPTYHLRSVQPLDMFPQTAHIECIAVLERKY
jgi:23S rRNA (uracil1939-C5)-methyltransferase